MSRLFIAFASFLLMFSHAASADDWSGSKKIDINPTASGAELKADVTQFPVLIRLHTGNFAHFMEMKEDGSDIRFFAGDEKTPLPYYVEKFDSLNELALIWVQVPRLLATKSDFIWMKYGNPQAANAQDAKAVYDANFSAVYHFEAAGMPKDQTANSNNPAQFTAEHKPASIIGAGAGFSGSQRIVIPGSPSLKFGETGFTFSAWVKIAAPQSDTVLFVRQDASNLVSVRVDKNRVFARVARDGKIQDTPRTGELSLGSWHHVAVTGGSRLAIYVDGRETGAVDVSTPALTGDIVLGAASSTGGSFFVGEIDEVQISNIARSMDWIQAAAKGEGLDAKLAAPGDDKHSEGSTSYVGTILRAVTVDGWAVIALLAVMAGISWWVMVSKFFALRVIVQDNKKFVQAFQQLSRDPGALDQDGNEGQSDLGRALSGAHDHYQMSPIYQVYHVGVQELKHRFGQTDTRLLHGQTLSPQAIDAIRASLDGAQVRENQKLNNLLVLLTIAISGGPFLGLLGTVVGVMITFAAIAASGDVNINAIAPGIAAALVATVAGLLVAIPALFGYNYIVSQIKNISADMQVFTDEFISKMAEQYAEGVIVHEDASRKRAV
jgi:biopolymer transport protein ExbB